MDRQRRLPTRAGRAARPQRHLHGLAQAATRTSRCSAGRCATPRALYEQGDEATLAAKIVGRWRNGDAAGRLTRREPPQRFDADGRRAPTTSATHADLDGRRCPLGAHIRRSNPRDALGFEGKLSFRHRMIRRGMPYGPPLPDGVVEDDGKDRGLVFVCFNASISRQFESVQRQWLNDGNIFRLGHDSGLPAGRPDRRARAR